MPTTESRDGTAIAFDRTGAGPAVILVDGALCYRAFGPSGPLAALLSKQFTVFTYDRRGRGESGDTQPWSIEREVEDIAALIGEAGGSALVYGISSGAALAAEAANYGLAIRKLALYEAPFVVDDSQPPLADDFLPRLRARIAQNRRGDAVKMFFELVGVPAPFRFLMQFTPMWSKLTGVAPTLVNDISIVGEHQTGRPLKADRWASVTVPTLVADGGKSPVWMRNATRSFAAVLPNATYRTLPGQTHNLSAKAIAPVLVEFFTG